MARRVRRIREWLSHKTRAQGLIRPEDFLGSISSIVGLDQLLENFSAKLADMLGSTAVYVALHEPITNRYVGKIAKGRNCELLEEFVFSHSDNLVKWLMVNNRVLHVPVQSEVLNFLSTRERELLRKSLTALVVPLIITNRLTGVLFIAGKIDGSQYSKYEMDSVLMLAGQTAFAIEHALIFQFQQEKLQKLLHADKLATVGELAAGAAHEIRNPLTSIRSTIQFLQRDLPDERKILANQVIEEVDRIDQIIKGLLSLSRTTELAVSAVDIKEILDHTLALLEPELRRQEIEVERVCFHSSALIRGDASQLKQVFLNVLLNSIEALPRGGKVSVRLGELPEGAGSHKDSRYAVVTISDTGCGIPAQDLLQVFDPFFSTKESGTGLGLSISYGIVSKHGGEIQIESRTATPSGTTVTVRLPLA